MYVCMYMYICISQTITYGMRFRYIQIEAYFQLNYM